MIYLRVSGETLLLNCSRKRERNYNPRKLKLSAVCNFKEGYYFISQKTAETFYNMMEKKDKMLPESALKFQEIKEQIENYIVNYQ